MRAYIGLGSNVGDRLNAIREAIREIGLVKEVKIVRLSSIYETEPIECEGGLFYNAVLEVETSQEPASLLKELMKIENDMGRNRVKKCAERKMDLDLLLYGDRQMTQSDLTLPHPRMHLRKFVLEPLCELNPDLIIPYIKKTVKEILASAEDASMVRKIIPIHAMGGCEVLS